MPLQVWRIRREGVYLFGPHARRVVTPEVPSAGDPEFAHCFIPDPPHALGARVNGSQIARDRQHIDDRLGMNAGNRCAADVVDGQQAVSERLLHLTSRTLEHRRPLGIVGDDRDLAHRPYRLRRVHNQQMTPTISTGFRILGVVLGPVKKTQV